MSRKVEFLEITPPDGLGSKNGRIFKFKGHSCPQCNGNGGFFVGGWQEKFKNNLDDPDWKKCPVCKGTGKLEANVLVNWVPYGEIKEQFK